jgi:apolipoprotein N-acyltransferase
MTAPRPSRQTALLLAGIVLTFLAHLRWNVGFLAWLAPVPFLRYLRTTPGLRARALVVAALVAAWIGACFKITTAPLPPVFALAVGAGIGVMAALPYLAWDLLGRRLPAARSALVFAAAVVTMEWLQGKTPLATWGAVAYTQVENLPLLQIASILGMAGVSFLVSCASAWIEGALSVLLAGKGFPWRQGLALATVLATVEGWGAWRLAETLPDLKVSVAAVGTVATFTGFPPPERPERDRIVATLLADTVRAAERGARLVVWTEAAAVVARGAEEQSLVTRVLEVARDHDLNIVAAFIVPLSEHPPAFENKLVWASPSGIRQTYAKHHPAPGEPAVVGKGPLEAVDADWGRAGAALCYDYDYPSMGRAHARLGVGIVALPSSDWRGIDPVHTQMAALRAIEGGFSIVRSTRFGLSAAIDGRGRIRAWRSSFDAADRVLLAELPSTPAATAYALVGDVLPWVSLALVGAMAALRLIEFRRGTVSRASGEEFEPGRG